MESGARSCTFTFPALFASARRGERTGRPLGSEGFIERLEGEFGRALKLQKPGGRKGKRRIKYCVPGNHVPGNHIQDSSRGWRENFDVRSSPRSRGGRKAKMGIRSRVPRYPQISTQISTWELEMNKTLRLLWLYVGNTAAILLCVFAVSYISTLGMLLSTYAERNPEQHAQMEVGRRAEEWTYYSRTLQTPPQLFWRLFGVKQVITIEDGEFLKEHAWVPQDSPAGVPINPNHILRPTVIAARALILQGSFWVLLQMVLVGLWKLLQSSRKRTMNKETTKEQKVLGEGAL